MRPRRFCLRFIAHRHRRVVGELRCASAEVGTTVGTSLVGAGRNSVTGLSLWRSRADCKSAMPRFESGRRLFRVLA